MAATFDTCFKFTVGHEGGYGADPRDRGNWTSGVIGKGELKGTKYGIAAHVYPHLDIKNLTLEQAKAIYKRDYWDKVAGDAMPAGVDLCVWDMGVNAGVSRGLSILKSALGITVGSASALATAARQASDKVALIKKYSAKRLAFYQGLSTFKTFGKGWTRRATECEAAAVKMALTAAGGSVKAELERESQAASAKATDNAGKAVATGAVPTATQVPGTPVPVDADWSVLVFLGLVAVVVGGIFVYRWYVNRERAKAYAAAAEGAQ